MDSYKTYNLRFHKILLLGVLEALSYKLAIVKLPGTHEILVPVISGIP